jgi:hypothetical protein
VGRREERERGKGEKMSDALEEGAMCVKNILYI